MSVGFWIFFIIICILGFSYLETGSYFGFLTGKKKEDARQQPKTPAYVPPVTLDDDEIRSLGEAAADWCGKWMLDHPYYSPNHSKYDWIVIELSRKQMDCRCGLGYPHCTINYSKEIEGEHQQQIARQILDIIYDRHPEMISLCGLYQDGACLILPTN